MFNRPINESARITENLLPFMGRNDKKCAKIAKRNVIKFQQIACLLVCLMQKISKNFKVNSIHNYNYITQQLSCFLNNKTALSMLIMRLLIIIEK